MSISLSRKPLVLSLAAVLVVGLTSLIVSISSADPKPDLRAEGDKQFEEKSYRKAYEAYEKFLKDNPDAADWFSIKLRMGHCQAQLGSFDKAETELVSLADSDKITEIQKARANYRLGHLYSTRPKYYYENSQGERAWGRWIADSRYISVERSDSENAKNRLAASFKLLQPLALKAIENFGKDPAESVAMVDEACNAGLDAAAALHTWQYHGKQKQIAVDFFDAHGQKQAYHYSQFEFADRDEILRQLDAVFAMAESFRAACNKAGAAPGADKEAREAATTGHTKAVNMAALALYRKAQFLVALRQIDDWSTRNVLLHPELEHINPLEGDDSPIPVFEAIWKDYNSTPYADDAQYFIGYCYQQVGLHAEAAAAYEVLINAEQFKDSTETSSARYNLHQLRQQRLNIATRVADHDIEPDTRVRKWHDGASWYHRDNRGTGRSMFKKGETLGLWVETRNVKEYEVRALTFNAAGLMQDSEFLDAHTAGLHNIGDGRIAEAVARHTGEKVFARTYTTGDDGTHKFTRMIFALPETLPPGAYLVEVDSGEIVNRRMVVVTDAQLVVQTYSPDENLAVMVDSETGAPLSGTSFIYKRWRTHWTNNEQHWTIDVSRYKSDAQGRVRVPTVSNNRWDGYLLFAESNGRYAWVQSEFPWWQRRGWNDQSTNDVRMYSVMSRPVYRPGDSVHSKILLRQRDGGEWKNVAGSSYRVELYNPRGEQKLSQRLTATSFGAIEIDMDLPLDAALGGWYYYVRTGSGNWLGSGTFRVEEYKKPEFEVSVAAPDKPVKLGQAVAATIKGEYYFGGPAAGADVKYKVFRDFYFHSVYFPRRYDWLYNWQTPMYYGTPDQQFHRNAGSELVHEGSGSLNEQGELVIEWATQKALAEWGDFDHQFRVEAEVTDSSRRTITGSGSVKALRRAFFAFVDNKLGFYRPGDKLDVEVRTVTADDKPVATKGKLEIHQVTFTRRTDDNGMPRIDEHKTLLGTVDMSTNEMGLAWYITPFDKAGTYELVYRTTDEWETEVVGSTRIIVKADSWTPGSFRFGTISLIPQQKVYTQGETASVLLASDFEDAWMLISVMAGREVITQSFVDMASSGGQLELELKVDRAHLPNFHINVLTIQRGELHTQTVEIFVPPVQQFLEVEISTDKDWYQPGDKGTVTVTALDSEGKPVAAEFALSIYDRSVEYIVPDRTPNIIKHFYGDRRSYSLNYLNSYNTGVAAAHWDRAPRSKDRFHGAPLGYGVRNWLIWERNHFDFDEESAKAESKSDRFARGFEGENRKNNADDPSADDAQEGASFRRARGGGSAGGRMEDSDGGAPAPSARVGAEPEDGNWGPAEQGEKQSDKSGKEALRNEFAEAAEEADAATPRVRSNFKDVVFYSHRVVTGADGKATIEVEFPDNLTDWKIAARGITSVAKVGEAKGSVKTKKQLILRDQAPRFFVEGDVVTLSGIIMNRYDVELPVRAMLALNPSRDAAKLAGYELFPETPDVQDIMVGPNSEVRIDWRVRMKSAGKFVIRMLALSSVESDATEKSYNCKVRGAEMYQATTSVITDEQTSQEFSVTLPDKLDPNQTNLDLQLSPSVAALAMDALPYLLEFPYGCVEQTMSRFLPAVIVRKTLEDAGVSLEEIGRRRQALEYQGVNPQAAYWYRHSPVFSTQMMESIIAYGLQRLAIMQQGDGGWGWWQNGQSDTYMTAYVCYGLHTAKAAGVKFDYSMLDRGVNFLAKLARTEKNVHRVAYIAYVLSYAGKHDKELLDLIYNRRDDLTHQSRAMICMAEWLAGDKERARILISNIEDYRKEDTEKGTVWWDGGREYWWWYNDKIETNAFVMQAFTMVDPTNKYLEQHVRWLAQNRKGSRWNSTKDTSHAVSALMGYARTTGELSRSYNVTVKLNGKPIHKWEVTPENIFSLQTNLRLTGQDLTPGKHVFTIEREGQGKVYFSSMLTYFSKEDHLKASGNELHIDRKYYKLVEKIEEVEVTRRNADGTTSKHKEKRLTHDRILLENGAKMLSGDVIEVELNLKADNDYEYLAFEDFKPAGCEPVALRSGQGYGGGLVQNVELRDDRVAFFVSYMPQGTARLKYQLRCEIPGTFSALPTQGGSMYVREVRANSEEWKVTISDKK